MEWLLKNWAVVANILGLLLATGGAFFAAFEVVRPFKGERFEAGIGSGPIGGVPTNDPPIETAEWKAFERRRFSHIRRGLWWVGAGTLLQLVGALPSFK